MQPTVSVCMTTYNHEAYIAQAIESVVQQRCTFGIELVVGVDCGSDRTIEICREYEQRYPDMVRVMERSENIGMRRNYAQTLAECRGDYVAICDGDDWWCDREKLHHQVEYLTEHPDVAMCFTRSERVSADGRREPYPPTDGDCSFEEMLRLNRAENCTTLARRAVIEEYYREVRPLEHTEWLTDDLPMWLWFAARHKIAFLDRVTACHRIVERSVSHSDDYRRRIAFCDSLGDIKLWADREFHNGEWREMLLRQRENEALWALARYGTVAEYAARWWQGVGRKPSLWLNVAGYLLIFKKLKFLIKR